MRAIPHQRYQTGGRYPLLAACAVAAILLVSCAAGGTRLAALAVPADEAQGTFRVHLYGCRTSGDVENMALLVNEASPYRFELFVPETSYRVTSSVPGPAAVAQARKFIRCGIYDRGRSVTRKIVDPEGRLIAYEIKPLYLWFEVGKDEALQTDYYLRGDTVTVYIKLEPQVARHLELDFPARERDRH